jgi:hypothetical protein
MVTPRVTRWARPAALHEAVGQWALPFKQLGERVQVLVALERLAALVSTIVNQRQRGAGGGSAGHAARSGVQQAEGRRTLSTKQVS